jgi:RNA polymerase sigma-70 factor, ECF subfamily
LSDRELLELLRQGDQEAFSTIFRTHYAPLVGLAEKMLRERALAEEVVQEVFLEVWRRRETIVVEESLRAYLFRATRNRSLNQIRHQGVEKRVEPLLAPTTVTSPTALSNLEEEEMEGAIQAAISELPPRCREIFELSRVHGLKYSEIATQLGISVKGVEAQMGKALRLLRERLAPWVPNRDDR